MDGVTNSSIIVSVTPLSPLKLMSFETETLKNKLILLFAIFFKMFLQLRERERSRNGLLFSYQIFRFKVWELP